MKQAVFLALLLCLSAASAQTSSQPDPPTAAGPDRPLPEIHALIQAVQARQRAAELAQQDYIYRQIRHTDRLNGKEEITQTTATEYDIFWLNGVEIEKLITKDGVPLTPEQQKKQSERIDKEVASARKRRAKADAEGKTTDSQGRPALTISLLLQGATFTNERRTTVAGRDTILFDFSGGPDARYGNPVKDMAGTLGIDETDQAVLSAEGSFVSDFKLLGGALMKIDKGTRFSYHTVKVNQEVWLPADYTLQGEARILLLMSGHVRFHETDGDYRKFSTRSRILPGFEEMPADAPSPTSPPPTPPQK